MFAFSIDPQASKFRNQLPDSTANKKAYKALQTIDTESVIFK